MNHLSVDVIHVHLLPFLCPLELVRYRQTCRAVQVCVDRFLRQYASVGLQDCACPRCGGWICRHALDTYDEFFGVVCPFERQRRWERIRQINLPVALIRKALLCDDCEYEDVTWVADQAVARYLPFRGDRRYSFFSDEEFVLLFHWVNEWRVQWNEFRVF